MPRILYAPTLVSIPTRLNSQLRRTTRKYTSFTSINLIPVWTTLTSFCTAVDVQLFCNVFTGRLLYCSDTLSHFSTGRHTLIYPRLQTLGLPDRVDVAFRSMTDRASLDLSSLPLPGLKHVSQISEQNARVQDAAMPG